VAHTDVSLRVNRRSGALPLDSSSTFAVWVGEFSGSLSAGRQMPVDVPPPRLLVASQECAIQHHTSAVEGLSTRLLEHISLLVFLGRVSSGQTLWLGITNLSDTPWPPAAFICSEVRSSKGSDQEIFMILENRMEIPKHSSEEPNCKRL
jgi:hypothetical protein